MRAIVVAILAALAACGAAKPKSEPTLFQRCYVAEIPMAPGLCKNPTPIPWAKKLPIEVYIADDYPHPDIVRSVLVMWNRWLGQDVFVPAESVDSADVLIVARSGTGNLAGLMQHVLENGRPLCLVSLFDEFEHDQEVIAHELGHVLGLDHDPDNKRSLMYPEASFERPSVTDADIVALRKHLGIVLLPD